MAPPNHQALPALLSAIFKPNPNCTTFQMRLRETYRINMTRGLVLDLWVALTFWVVALGVDRFLAPVPIKSLILGWAVLWGLTWIFKLPSIRRSECDASLWITLGYGTTAIAVGMSFGLIDRAVQVPITVLGTIGIGGSWMLFPHRGWRAVVGPATSSMALALAYLAVFEFHFPSNYFWLALIAGSATGIIMGVFGSASNYYNAAKDFELRLELEDAVAQAKHAVKAKAEFLATMSHEIRTPLNGVIGMVSLLNRTKLDDSQKEKLATVGRSGNTLLAIINDILDFSKIEAGQLQLETLDFNLKSLAEDMVQITQFGVGEKDLQIQLAWADDTPDWIVGDPTRMRQVIQNLMSNASKFTQAGSVTLKLGAKSKGINQVELMVEVIDTGIGIAPDQQKKLFQPFSQADTSTTRKFGGTGLGLAICMQIVEQMGGQIGIRSEPGKGSCFWFEIPVHIGTEQVAEQAAPGPILATPGKDQCVLLVEDNSINRKLAIAILKELDLPYEVAKDGAEAVATYSTGSFSLALMDCCMPVMDGYEATQKIRQLEKGGPRMPIIALTANALAGDRQKALDAGMDDHLSKPYAVEDLQRVLAKWMPSDRCEKRAS
jgi:signal transduction histidine kinase/CheY-like chemotaxis protein